MLQVYLGSVTPEFMLYIGEIFVSALLFPTTSEVESLRVQSFVVSYISFTLKGGARHQFINVNSTAHVNLLYTRALRAYYPEAR